MSEIMIVPTGTANLASVLAAIARAGAEPRIASGVRDLESAKALVLPGVGSFGSAMGKLEAEGFARPLRALILSGVPTLAICLGMQILFEASDESPGSSGLSIFPGRFERFPTTVRSPHVGWNYVEPVSGAKFLQSGDAYFTHSYCLRTLPPQSIGATTLYDAPFVSAVESGNILACQFHPELSSGWGIELIQRWLRQEARGC